MAFVIHLDQDLNNFRDRNTSSNEAPDNSFNVDCNDLNKAKKFNVYYSTGKLELSHSSVSKIDYMSGNSQENNGLCVIKDGKSGNNKDIERKENDLTSKNSFEENEGVHDPRISEFNNNKDNNRSKSSSITFKTYEENLEDVIDKKQKINECGNEKAQKDYEKRAKTWDITNNSVYLEFANSDSDLLKKRNVMNWSCWHILLSITYLFWIIIAIGKIVFSIFSVINGFSYYDIYSFVASFVFLFTSIIGVLLLKLSKMWIWILIFLNIACIILAFFGIIITYRISGGFASAQKEMLYIGNSIALGIGFICWGITLLMRSRTEKYKNDLIIKNWIGQVDSSDTMKETERN